MTRTNEADLSVAGGRVRRLPLLAGAAPFAGALLSWDSTGYVHALVAGEPFAGVCIQTVPAGGYAANGAGFVQAMVGQFAFTTVSAISGVDATDVPTATSIYASDDSTLTTTDTGNTKIGAVSGMDGTRAVISAATVDVTASAAGVHASSHISTGIDPIPAAVAAGASGLMTGADKSKLDAATASPTVSTLMLRDGAGRAQAVNPSAAQDIATKAYADSVAAGLDIKPSVKCATTANITLSGEQTLDGVLTAASRVLVKNQTAPAENGIYVSGAGAWTRAEDMDAWAEVPGAFTFVEQGTLYADCAFVSTANSGGTLDTTAITWSQFAGVGTYTAGSGLTLTGAQFAADFGATAGKVTEGNDARLTDSRTPAGTATAAVIAKTVALTDAATIAIDAALGNKFKVTLDIAGATRVLGNPTNPVAGQVISLAIKQDGSGSRLLTFDTAYRGSTDLPLPTISTTASAKDRLVFEYDGDDSKWDFLAIVKGY